MFDLRLHLSQTVLRNSEDHGDRLHLRDDSENRATCRLNNIAGIDQSQTNPSCNRRSDMAERDLNLIELNRALVVLDGAFILKYELFLVIEGLFWNAILGPRLLIALQIHLRLGQHVGVALECTLGLQ